jgi:hypothetical protein
LGYCDFALLAVQQKRVTWLWGICKDVYKQSSHDLVVWERELVGVMEWW